MVKSTPLRMGLFSGVLLLAPALTLAQTKAPDVKVTLHASVAAIGAGQPVDVGIQFELPEGFHIYWENPGDSGMAPTVNWTLPPGFSAGPLRFPAPTTHQAAGLTTYVLEGSPVLLTTITPPADLAPGQQVKLTADVIWLVCKEMCFRQTRKVELTLPTAAQPKPAAEDGDGAILAIAARKLPVAGPAGKFATVTATTSSETVAQGDKLEVVLKIAVKPGYHVQSHKPTQKDFVAAAVFPRALEGIEIGTPTWPEPKIRRDAALKIDISEFVGDFEVRIPFEVIGPTAGADLRVSGLFKYQACDEKGRCYPAEALEWSAPLRSTTVAAGADTEAASGEAPIGSVSETPSMSTSTETENEVVAETPRGFFARIQSALLKLGFTGVLILGFLGGIILNVMPCVLPVVAIKVLGFVQQAKESPRRVFLLGLTFAFGIIVSFWAIAGIVLIIKYSTQGLVSWGLLFQMPGFIVGMLIVLFVFALNLFGVFEIMLPGAAATRLAGAAEREGYPGAFFKGAFATLLATPCTAPLLAPAISYALAADTASMLGVFTAAGVGMAFPYIVLTARPGWMKLLPKPGTWMIRFKQFTGFLLIGTAVWLLWILGHMRGSDAVVWSVALLGFIGLAAWIFGMIEYGWPAGKKVTAYVASALVIAGGVAFVDRMYVPPQLAQTADVAPGDIEAAVAGAAWGGEEIPWVDYRKGLAEALAARGYTVYVDYTAVWCLTCQANKKLVLSTEAIRSEMAAKGVIPIKADYTNPDKNIAADLQRFKQDAVPLNLIYPAGRPDKPIVLPVILTPGIVKEALDEAGPSTAARFAAAQTS